MNFGKYDFLPIKLTIIFRVSNLIDHEMYVDIVMKVELTPT